MIPTSASATPLASVVMLAYNQAHLIGRALDSVLAQRTDFPFEIVVGEDGSADATRAVIEKFVQRFPQTIRLLPLANHAGARQNYHQCIRAARGRYLAFCDGDDYWHRTDKLQLQVAHLETHLDCGLVYSDYDLHDTEHNRIIARYHRQLQRAIPAAPGLEDIIAGRAGILTCTVALRAALAHEAQRSDPYLHLTGPFLMSDSQLWAEIAAQAAVHYIRDSLATYTQSSESLSHSRDPVRSVGYALSNDNMFLYLCAKHKLPDELRRWHEHRQTMHQLQLAFWKCDPVLGREAQRRLGRIGWRSLAYYAGSQSRTVHWLLRRVAQQVR